MTREASLHSTMFLLIPSKLMNELFCSLSLHSTMFLLIPALPLLMGVRTDDFTFHNVSINTMRRDTSGRNPFETLHSTMFLLILTQKQSYRSGKSALHSTMFLLIRWIDGSITIRILPLHSTMFLLILILRRNTLLNDSLFTFHNVSINTRAPHPHIIQDLFYHFLSTLSFTIFLKQNLHSQ